MQLNQGDTGRFAAYMFMGLMGLFLLGGLTPLVFVVAILFVVVIAIAGAVGLGKD